LAQFVAAYPGLKLPVTFDNWYTQPAFCRYLDNELSLPYVGALSESNEVVLKTGRETLKSFADRLKREHLAAIAEGGKPLFHKITIPYKGEKETYYPYHGILAWLPRPTAYCAPRLTTRLSSTSFNVNSSMNWRTALPLGDAPLARKVCGI
jgi:hypothetical protein